MNNIKTIASGILAAFVGGWALGLSFGLADCIAADTAMHQQAVKAAFASMKH